jgi:cytochrome c oxidase assembly factor CtaG
VAGIAAAVAAVSPPIDVRAHDGLTWHMAQHLVLLGVVAPLLVLSGMRAWRPPATPVPLGLALVLVLGHVLVVMAWHLPPLFDAAERSVPVHVVEHLSFIGAAVALWWGAGLGARAASPVVALGVFVASLPGIALGAAMTLAPTTWYSSYTSLPDQQVAGALMWSIGGMVTVVCGVVSLARSLSAMEATA